MRMLRGIGVFILWFCAVRGKEIRRKEVFSRNAVPNGYYKFTENVIVRPKGSLYIEPGVTVAFAPSKGIFVDGGVLVAKVGNVQSSAIIELF